MHDFFGQQDIARRNTVKLLLFFALATLLVILLVASVFHFLITFQSDPGRWDWALWLRIAAVVLAFILLCSGYKYWQLKSGGGAIIAQLCGGRPVLPDTQNLRERRLLNIVEEMALAAGITVPSVYLLEREMGINAFAAGFSQEDAVVGVTQGALLYLDRDELQGVVAHEFSHILHGDMLINLRLQGVLHGILALGLLGRVLLRGSVRRQMVRPVRSGSRNHGDGSQFLLIGGLLLLVLGYLGALLGKLIKSAIVRQREFLADAAAVQFTRNPQGLAGALAKIGGLKSGGRINDPHAAELSHLYFENAISGRSWAWFSTHPPLIERIRRLDPRFQGELPREVQPTVVDDEERGGLAWVAGSVGSGAAGSGGGDPGGIGPGGMGPGRGLAGAGNEPFIRLPKEVDADLSGTVISALLSDPTAEHLVLARRMLAQLPERIRLGVRNPFSARAVAYGLLLESDPEIRSRQLAILEAQANPKVFAQLKADLAVIEAIGPALRLPLIDLLVPTLKSLSPQQYQRFRDNLQALIGAWPQLALFPYCLQHLLLKRLDRHFDYQRQAVTAATSVDQWRQISLVLTILARRGHPEQEATAAKAFMRGSRQFKKEMKYLEYLPPPQATLHQLTDALNHLDQSDGATKQLLLAAALTIIAHDGVITVAEAELLRVIAESLSLPSPLLTGNQEPIR